MGAQASFAEGMRAAKEVQKDLQWTQKRVEYVSGRFRTCAHTTDALNSSLNDRAARKYPEQFRTAQRRYPAPVDY
jgi:hypothetical protein